MVCRRVHDRQRGAALTEFAILMPLLIGVFYASIYLLDLGVFRLEAQEVAYFRTWSFARLALSEFSDGEHEQAFVQASDRVEAAELSLYQRLLTVDSRQTSAAMLTVDPFSRAQQTAPLLPNAVTLDLPAPEGTAGLLAGALDLTGSTNDIAAKLFDRAKFNVKGLVSGRATLALLAPVRSLDRQRTETLAAIGAPVGFDVRALTATPRGQSTAGATMTVGSTVLMDPWRLSDGFAALPEQTDETLRAFARTVGRLHSEAPDILPSFFGRSVRGAKADDPGRYVVSRPYLTDRACERVNESFLEQSGQFNPFARSGVSRGQLQEPGAVSVFESLPLFDTPRPACGDMASELNRRGRNFMGCKESQSRRCR